MALEFRCGRDDGGKGKQWGFQVVSGPRVLAYAWHFDTKQECLEAILALQDGAREAPIQFFEGPLPSRAPEAATSSAA
jgi:hypothetical protein